MKKEYDQFWKFHNPENMDVHAVILIRSQQAENKKLRERLKIIQRWHSVKKELPQTKGLYCHLYIPSLNKKTTFKGWYHPERRVWLTTTKSHTTTNKVTHWQIVTLPNQALTENKPEVCKNYPNHPDFGGEPCFFNKAYDKLKSEPEPSDPIVRTLIQGLRKEINRLTAELKAKDEEFDRLTAELKAKDKAIGLLNSMVLSGETHSEKSRQIVEQAPKDGKEKPFREG